MRKFLFTAVMMIFAVSMTATAGTSTETVDSICKTFHIHDVVPDINQNGEFDFEELIEVGANNDCTLKIEYKRNKGTDSVLKLTYTRKALYGEKEVAVRKGTYIGGYLGRSGTDNYGFLSKEGKALFLLVESPYGGHALMLKDLTLLK